MEVEMFSQVSTNMLYALSYETAIVYEQGLNMDKKLLLFNLVSSSFRNSKQLMPIFLYFCGSYINFIQFLYLMVYLISKVT